MLDERKSAILRAVVEEHISTAQPVGSGHVARIGEIRVSPATVRNEMALLEREGYLTQPHTSAGRIPTDKGYRYFVDSLALPSMLERSESQRVQQFFDGSHGEIEQLLADTTTLLSGLTDYAAVVVGPAMEAAVVRSVQVVGLGPRNALLVLVLGNGGVEKRTLELGADTAEHHLAEATLRLSAALLGHSVGADATVAPSGDPVSDAVCATAVAALRESHDTDAEHVFVGGASRMAASFDAVDTVRKVLGILEQQVVVVGLLREVLDRGAQVSIGSENRLEPLAECSVVVAPYEVDGEPAGTIGVLGPTRMHYPHALAAVAVVSERLSRRLAEG